MPSEAQRMTMMPAAKPTSAPATGKAREARRRSKAPSGLPPMGTRVRKLAAVCKSSVHSTEDQSSGAASVGFSSSSIFPLSFR